MRIGKNSGSAMIEFAAMAPLAALFLIIIVQFAALFTQAVHDVASAGAKATDAINEWSLSQAGSGFKRPCLEEITPKSFMYGGEPVKIGVGAWQRGIRVPQEVRIVAEPICVNW